MHRLARRYRFAASHRLHSPELTPEQNRDLYGKCNNPFGHGHNYTLELVIQGAPDPATGLLIDIPRLDAHVRELVLRHYDQKFMNEEIPEFRQTPPTTENVALDIRRRLADGWERISRPGASLETVRIFETRRNSVEL